MSNNQPLLIKQILLFNFNNLYLWMCIKHGEILYRYFTKGQHQNDIFANIFVEQECESAVSQPQRPVKNHRASKSKIDLTAPFLSLYYSFVFINSFFDLQIRLLLDSKLTTSHTYRHGHNTRHLT